MAALDSVGMAPLGGLLPTGPTYSDLCVSPENPKNYCIISVLRLIWVCVNDCIVLLLKKFIKITLLCVAFSYLFFPPQYYAKIHPCC